MRPRSPRSRRPSPPRRPRSSSCRPGSPAVLEREGVPGVGLALVDRQGLVWAGGVGVADREDRQTGRRRHPVPRRLDHQERGRPRRHAPGRAGPPRPRPAARELMPEVVPQATLGPKLADHPRARARAHRRLRRHALQRVLRRRGHGPARRSGAKPAAASPAGAPAAACPTPTRATRSPATRSSWRPGRPGTATSSARCCARSGCPRPASAARRSSPIAWRPATWAAREAATFARSPTPRPGRCSPRRASWPGSCNSWLVRGEDRRSSARRRSPASSGPRRSPIAPTDTNYGLGNYGDVLHPSARAGTTAASPGFLSCYRYFPDLGVGYVMLLNGSHSVRAYAEIRALLFAYLARGRPCPSRPRPRPTRGDRRRDRPLRVRQPARRAVRLHRAGDGRHRVRPDPDGIALDRCSAAARSRWCRPARAAIATRESGYQRSPRHRRGGPKPILAPAWAYFEAGSRAWARGRCSRCRPRWR
jgi:hypothetical protein